MDPKKEAAKLGAGAMLDAGKDAARRLYEDLVLTDEEKAKREAEREAAARRKRRKWIALGVGTVVALLALFMIITKYLPWAIAFAVLAGLGYYGYRKARARLRGGRTARAALDDAETKGARRAERAERAVPERAERAAVRVDPAPDPAVARRAAAAAQAERERAHAENERAIDEELAALKRKVRE